MRWHYPGRDQRQQAALHSGISLQGEGEVVPAKGNLRADPNRSGEGFTDVGGHLASFLARPS